MTTSATIEASSMLEESQHILLSELDSLRKRLGVNATNAKMIAILDEFPCLLKCHHYIGLSGNNYVDPLYGERHDYVKKTLIEAIVRRFSNKLAVTSEQAIDNGTIDICLYSNKIIHIDKDKKRVGIEVKSGKTLDFFQIGRYLCQLDVLIFVRVPTQEVTKISQKDVLQELSNINFSRIEKIRQIKEQLIKVQGEWCKGCSAPCQYKRPGNDTLPKASLRDYAEFVKNVNVVTGKLIRLLEIEFGTK